jgi:hypothetical protein
MGVGAETVVADHGLAPIGDMGRHPGDELEGFFVMLGIQSVICF